MFLILSYLIRWLYNGEFTAKEERQVQLGKNSSFQNRPSTEISGQALLEIHWIHSLLRDGSLNKCKMLKNNNTSHPECSTTSRIRVNIIWGWNVTCVQPKWWIPTFYPLSIKFLFPIGIIFPLALLPQFYITTYWPFLLQSVDKEEMAPEKLLGGKKSPFSCVVILEEFYNASF